MKEIKLHKIRDKYTKLYSLRYKGQTICQIQLLDNIAIVYPFSNPKNVLVLKEQVRAAK